MSSPSYDVASLLLSCDVPGPGALTHAHHSFDTQARRPMEVPTRKSGGGYKAAAHKKSLSGVFAFSRSLVGLSFSPRPRGNACNLPYACNRVATGATAVCAESSSSTHLSHAAHCPPPFCHVMRARPRPRSLYCFTVATGRAPDPPFTNVSIMCVSHPLPVRRHRDGTT